MGTGPWREHPAEMNVSCEQKISSLGFQWKQLFSPAQWASGCLGSGSLDGGLVLKSNGSSTDEAEDLQECDQKLW